jgi:Tfp pilus assembly protein PilF
MPTARELLADARAAHAAGRPADAERLLRHAAALPPPDAEVLTQLGVLVAEQGHPADAVPILERATHADPTFAPAFLNLGVAFAHAGRPADALPPLEAAARLNPAYPDAQFNLGNVLKELGRPADAEARYRDAVRLRPDHPAAHTNLGLLLTEAGRPEEAVILLRHAARLDPACKDYHNNLGLALNDLGRFADSEASYERALALDPLYAEAHANLAGTHTAAGRVAEAIAGYDLALRLQPDSPVTRYNRSLALLKAGDYARGWAEYEWRWRKPAAPPRAFPYPRWDGGDVAGRTVLLWCEQGLGDAIQFVRFARHVQALGARTVVECPPPLAELFATCAGVDVAVPEGEPVPACDLHCPLLSVPAELALGRDVGTAGPYLAADPERARRWRGWLSRWPGRKVGVAWQGNPRHKWDRFRSLPLATLAGLAAEPGATLVSLQRGHGSEQLADWAGPEVVALPEGMAAGERWTFADTAAVVATLDAVVAVDTAVAHLAGALGVPTRVWLGRVTDWRWGTAGERTTWYPSVTLTRTG